MKVVYEKSVKEKIDNEILAAKDSGKIIDKIILTNEEWNSFLHQVKDQYLYYTTCALWRLGYTEESKAHFLYKGILVFKEDKENVV